jgi:hypothetical protein
VSIAFARAWSSGQFPSCISLGPPAWPKWAHSLNRAAMSAFGSMDPSLHSYLLAVFDDDVCVNSHHFGRYFRIADY